jgi:hypothetical protein
VIKEISCRKWLEANGAGTTTDFPRRGALLAHHYYATGFDWMTVTSHVESIEIARLIHARMILHMSKYSWGVVVWTTQRLQCCQMKCRKRQSHQDCQCNTIVRLLFHDATFSNFSPTCRKTWIDCIGTSTCAWCLFLNKSPCLKFQLPAIIGGHDMPSFRRWQLAFVDVRVNDCCQTREVSVYD